MNEAKLFFILYCSKATSLLSEDELFYLLEQSRRNNEALGITGMLLYVKMRQSRKLVGRFMQVLEGPEDAVRTIFGRIGNDHRNYHVLLLREGPLNVRRFTGWAMGFEKIEPGTEQPGYFDPDILFNDDWAHEHADAIFLALKSFYR